MVLLLMLMVMLSSLFRGSKLSLVCGVIGVVVDVSERQMIKKRD